MESLVTEQITNKPVPQVRKDLNEEVGDKKCSFQAHSSRVWEGSTCLPPEDAEAVRS